MCAALVISYCMDFIYDNGFHTPQNCAAALGREQDVQRLRRRYENVRRPLEHRPPLVHERVAGTNRSANLRHKQPALADRKSTRLNSSHSQISYAVFCLKKKNKEMTTSELT